MFAINLEVNLMSFSNDIKRIRKKGLMSQEAFAQVIGVSFSTVNRWECGKAMPSYKAMNQIDEYCKANSIDFDISKYFLEEQED